MKYAMTILSPSTTGRWETCKATTLTAAKAEATRELASSGYGGDWLTVAEIHDGRYRPVARRCLHGGKWQALTF